MDVSPELDADAALALYFGQFVEQEQSDEDTSEMTLGRIDRTLIEELVRGVAMHRDELDGLLGSLSKNWRVERMALVDRNVIRLALFELKFCADVPTNVVLNEAIELAKLFGTAEASAFVNGLLDRAVNELDLRR
jgi:N utilization substance protein B